jgi:hypothetical protein
MMDWTSVKKRLGFGIPKQGGRFVAPAFALELEPGFVAAARLSPSKRRVLSVDVRELPAGLLAPSASKSNIVKLAEVRQTIAEAAQKVGHSGGGLGLLIPDVAVRVALLQFESLPENAPEADGLVLWRMREYLPYPPEEARLSYQVLAKEPGAVEVLALAVRMAVLAEYEAVVGGLNGSPALLLPATVALLPLLPEGPAGQLLLHLCPGTLTAVVVAGNHVHYWRTRSLEAEATDEVEEVSREATRVLAACQDNLHIQVENVWFCARPPAGARVGDALTATLGRELLPLQGNLVPTGGLPPGQGEIFESYGLPFAGLVANVG